MTEVVATDDELFCADYERQILCGIEEGKLERWVPGICNEYTHREHIARYNWVSPFVKGKHVLDIACGVGFGSFVMATEGQAATVLGVDIDNNTIRYATAKNKADNLKFSGANAEDFKTNERFDVIVSFETIEHLDNPHDFLMNIAKVLHSTGSYFLSTPISMQPENKMPDNVYHKTEWGFKKFHELVEQVLKIEEVYLQLNPASDSGFVSKLLQKAGISTDELPSVEQLMPKKWNPATIAPGLIGSTLTGYQILRCSNKSDG